MKETNPWNQSRSLLYTYIKRTNPILHLCLKTSHQNSCVEFIYFPCLAGRRKQINISPNQSRVIVQIARLKLDPWISNICRPIFIPRILDVSQSVKIGLERRTDVAAEATCSPSKWLNEFVFGITIFHLWLFLLARANFAAGFPMFVIFLVWNSRVPRVLLLFSFPFPPRRDWNEMLTAQHIRSLALSLSPWASELLIACDCWHCWASLSVPLVIRWSPAPEFWSLFY